MIQTTLQDLETEIRQIIFKMTGLEMQEISLEAHFYKDLGIDSIKGIEMTVALQEKYHIRINDSTIPNLVNLKLVTEEVYRLLNKT